MLLHSVYIISWYISYVGVVGNNIMLLHCVHNKLVHYLRRGGRE